MQMNWSLILNVLLLIGVVVAISRVIVERRKNSSSLSTKPMPTKPIVGGVEKTNDDEIVSVRQVMIDDPVDDALPLSHTQASSQKTHEQVDLTVDTGSNMVSVMIFLLAKDNRQLAGYELLQTLLAAGLRFGDGQMFHRHQHINGQGPVLCSLAAATASGTFDLQNIGAFSVHGLCLFMQASGNSTIDAQRFNIMLDTAKQLSDDLDTHLLDEKRKPFSKASLQRYHRTLGIYEHHEQCETV